MHRAVRDFCKEIKSKYPQHFLRKRVLDCGSLDVNGNNRYLFDECEYTGIDVGEGANVDSVSMIHEWDGEYDTIISTECFEHDAHLRESVGNIVRMLAPGGLFLFTCAGPGRKEHGTTRTRKKDAPLLEWEHYENVTEGMICNITDCLWPREYRVVGLDLQFYGIKPEECHDS